MPPTWKCAACGVAYNFTMRPAYERQHLTACAISGQLFCGLFSRALAARAAP